MKKRLSWALMVLCLGCGEEAPPDGGSPDASPDAARLDGGPTCARNADCEDDLFCTEHACMPGAPAADARGCVLLDGPCMPSEMCVEASSSCMALTCGDVQDADLDGEPSMACGGNDCDDDDNRRFPGAVETCDTEGLDEDCNPDTVASDTDGDTDDDGFTSELCCNGASCGDDCNDEDRGVFPGARELCNGIDDDCDGTTDEETGDLPLCPGGTCTAGRCDLPAWDRTFGGADEDLVFGVAMDSRGRVYVAGTFEGSVDFGAASGPITTRGSSDIYVASYEANGTFRWAQRYGGVGGDVAFDIAYDAANDLLYFTSWSENPVDFGSGVPSEAPASRLVALDTSGSHVWDRALPAISIPIVLTYVEAGAGVVATGLLVDTFDFGGGARTAVGARDAFVVRYDETGTYQWDVVFTSESGEGFFPARAAMESDRVLVSGSFTGSVVVDGVTLSSAGNRDIYLVGLDADGNVDFRFTAGDTGDDGASSVAAATDGSIYLAGAFEGSPDFGDGPVPSTGSVRSFIVRLTATGGHRATRLGASSGQSAVMDIASTGGGDIVVVGSAAGTVNLGGGTRAATADGAAFRASYDAELNHQNDRLYPFGAFPAACPYANCRSTGVAVVVGPADSTVMTGAFEGDIDLGTGVRLGTEDSDVFLLRLGD